MKKQGKINIFYVYKKEIIMTAVLLLLAVISLLFINLTRTDGSYAEVAENGAVIAVYPLDKDGEYILADGKNVLVIKDGCAYMASADCPDRTCQKTGKISKIGESIVCLPNKISVVIIGEGDGPDIIT